jgi:hypothetical protein
MKNQLPEQLPAVKISALASLAHWSPDSRSRAIIPTAYYRALLGNQQKRRRFAASGNDDRSLPSSIVVVHYFRYALEFSTVGLISAQSIRYAAAHQCALPFR